MQEPLVYSDRTGGFMNSAFAMLYTLHTNWDYAGNAVVNHRRHCQYQKGDHLLLLL